MIALDLVAAWCLLSFLFLVPMTLLCRAGREQDTRAIVERSEMPRTLVAHTSP